MFNNFSMYSMKEIKAGMPETCMHKPNCFAYNNYTFFTIAIGLYNCPSRQLTKEHENGE